MQASGALLARGNICLHPRIVHPRIPLLGISSLLMSQFCLFVSLVPFPLVALSWMLLQVSEMRVLLPPVLVLTEAFTSDTMTLRSLEVLHYRDIEGGVGCDVRLFQVVSGHTCVYPRALPVTWRLV